MSTEKKTINCKGIELECIESGYWPDGVTLVMCDVEGQDVRFSVNTIFLHENIALYVEDGKRHNTGHWNYWALLPPKPAPRRLTNRETYGLWRKGYDFQSNCGTIMEPAHNVQIENCAVPDGWKLRAPNTDEWLEPTSDLLEVGE